MVLLAIEHRKKELLSILIERYTAIWIVVCCFVLMVIISITKRLSSEIQKQNPTKYAIAIGGNPRLCKCDQVDTTNAYLSEYFYHKNYKGYILINLFTVLTEGIDSNSNYYNLNDYLFYNPFDMANYLKISLSIILALLILYLMCFYFGETTILNLLCMIYGL